MNKLPFFLALSFIFVLNSCSDDDSNISETQTANYFPLTEGNQWTYLNAIQVEDENMQEGSESLTAIAEENQTYSFERSGDLVLGFTTNILSSGEVYKQDNSLFYTGDLSLDLNDFGSFPLDVDPIGFTIENGILYNKSAAESSTLYSTSDQVTQELNYQGQSFDLVINYTVVTTQGPLLTDFSVNQQSFADVLTSEINISMSIEADIGFVSIPLLNETKVAEATNYYAKDIGLIHNTTNYNLETEAINEFGIPSLEYHAELSQNIESYTIN